MGLFEVSDDVYP